MLATNYRMNSITGDGLSKILKEVEILALENSIMALHDMKVVKEFSYEQIACACILMAVYSEERYCDHGFKQYVIMSFTEGDSQ